MKKAIYIALASALVTTGVIKAAPALAEAPAAQISIVRTADLDLSSSAGQRSLDRRLVQAVRQVCGEASDSDLQGKNDVRQCRDETLAKAHAKRDSVVAGRGVIAVTASR